MKAQEIKIAIEKANEIGSFSAKNNLSRTPAHNSMFTDFLKPFVAVEFNYENIKITNKLIVAFADSYTDELLKIARVKFLSK